MFWYRNRVNETSRQPGALLADPVCEVEAVCLAIDGNHSLFAFTDLGLGNAVWLPRFSASHQACFAFRAYPGEGMFGFGTLALSEWLLNRRQDLLAKKLLLLRPPPERKIRRPKIFRPKKTKAQPHPAKREKLKLF